MPAHGYPADAFGLREEFWVLSIPVTEALRRQLQIRKDRGKKTPRLSS